VVKRLCKSFGNKARGVPSFLVVHSNIRYRQPVGFANDVESI
jgi:hypothetical protein